MKFTARQISELIGGTVEGDPGVSVDRLSKIEEGEPGSLSFLANPKYTQYIYSTRASIIIVSKDFTPENKITPTLIKVADPYDAFARLLDYYDKVKQDKKGISSLAFISDSATIGNNLYIGEFAHIGDNAVIGDNAKIYPHVYLGDNVRIGSGTVLYSGAKIYTGTVIGDNCTLHSCVVVGSDGFGFAPQENSDFRKVAQIGNVIIEDNVEIGSSTTIDRATLGSTIIRRGVKLDNLIQIAHNVEIGENTVVAAQTGISGSTKIGRNCMIAGQVGITGHLIIGDNVKIGAQSGISQNLKDGEIVVGSPAFEVRKYWRSYAYFKNMGNLVERIAALEKKLKELSEQKP